MIYTFVIYRKPAFSDELKVKGMIATMDAIVEFKKKKIYKNLMKQWEEENTPTKMYNVSVDSYYNILSWLFKLKIGYLEIDNIIVTIPTKLTIIMESTKMDV